MKMFVLAGLLIVSSAAFAQGEVIKTKITEVKKKGCPVVNGKEDCTVQEVKTKVIETKKKLTY